jgi:TctA family transporter|tara:strand:+ start:3635 stop:5119 length:1485 start_codon:yes stop_codon:yes gene_type:complete
MLENLALGIETAITLNNLGFVVLGVMVGIFIGVLPGIGAVTAIALLLPLSFQLDATGGLILLAGIWYGATFGGSITAILLNIPGTTSNAVTCIDGNAMTRQGRGSLALFTAVVASFVGGSIGIIVMMLFTVPIARFAAGFSSVEYFSLIIFGLVAASSISESSVAKGLATVVAGVMIGCVGTDIYSGQGRFTFGNLDLMNGVTLVAVSMGVFGVSEVIATLRGGERPAFDRSGIRFRAMLPSRAEWRAISGPILRGSGIGSFFGTLPGTGPAIAAFMAYATEGRTKSRSRLGQGAIEGVAAPEAANNAADMTAFIPTLALGIPGSATMALMLGALIVNGISPGPQMMTNEPALFWGLIVSFWIGNIVLLVLAIPLIGLWARLLLVPFRMLMPAILVFICMGAFSVSGAATDVWLVLGLGLFGTLARSYGFPLAPVILGFVLGPMLEEHFRRAMLISRGDPAVFLQGPISAGLLAVTAAILIWSVASNFKRMRRD